MKGYDSYKDSGLEWVGEIPSHWKTGKLYQYSEMSNGSTPSRVKPEYWEDGTIPWMSSGEINKRKIKQIDGRISREGFENSSTRLLPIGTVMMGLNGQGKTKGTVGILEIETTCNQSLCGMIFKDSVVPMFSFYFLDSQYYHIRGLVGEGQREGISVTFLGRYPFLIPPLSEQQQIVSFLDSKTSQIDELIQKKERKIELLKEYLTSLINKVVTKGLNPNVEMKDSGVEWIGEIPSGWERKKLKHISKIFGRIGFRGYTTEDIVDEGEGVITISPSNIKNDVFSIENSTYLSWEKYYESPEIQIFPNDIIIVKTGSTIGKTSIIPNGTPEMTLNPQLIVLKEIQINPKYFYYQTVCKFIKESFDIEQTGSTTPTISQEKINGFPILTPPLSEQQQIVEYLDEQTQKIDSSIQTEERKIELLKEYRQSLISSVVTGKIDVRTN